MVVPLSAILKCREKIIFSIQDHLIVQQIDSEISQREARLSELQVERVVLTKRLLKSTYEYARIICQHLNIQQWLLEQLVDLNQCEFCCPISELQNRLLMRLNSMRQDASY